MEHNQLERGYLDKSMADHKNIYLKHAALNLAQAIHDLEYFDDLPDESKEAAAKERAKSLVQNLFFMTVDPMRHHTDKELKGFSKKKIRDIFKLGLVPGKGLLEVAQYTILKHINEDLDDEIKDISKQNGIDKDIPDVFGKNGKYVKIFRDAFEKELKSLKIPSANIILTLLKMIDILCVEDLTEWAGAGINGAPSFQGVAYGYGGRAQLAGPPRPYPPDFEQVVDELVADELNDMFGGSEKPIWTREGKIHERNASDANYHDLPGFPATNTLVAKNNFVPVDPAEQDNVDWLGPTVAGIALNDIPNNTANNWKATTPEKRGKQIVDIDALVKNQALPEGMVSGAGLSPGASTWSGGTLVAPKDWAQEREENATGDMDARNPLGGMGVVNKPQRFVPDSAENQVRMEIIKPQGQNMSKNPPKIDENLEEVEQVGTADMNQRLIAQMTALSQKHGGKGLEDYERVVPPAEKQNMLKQGNFQQKIGGLKQAAQDRQTREKIQAAQKNAPLVQGLRGLRGQQPAKDVKFFPPPPLKTEDAGTSEGADVHGVEELTTYLLNDRDLYIRGIVPVIKNLKKKMAKGKFNPELALKLWFYVVSAAAQKYTQEYDLSTQWQKAFSVATRKEVAKNLADHFSSEFGLV